MRPAYVKKFSSFAEAEAWEDYYYRDLSPSERMEIFFALLALNRPDETETQAGIIKGLSRVHRVSRSK